MQDTTEIVEIITMPKILVRDFSAPSDTLLRFLEFFKYLICRDSWELWNWKDYRDSKNSIFSEVAWILEIVAAPEIPK